MRALLTGASGCVGRAVAAGLLARGHEVRAVVHHAAAPHGTEEARASLLDVDALARAAEGCDAVIHLAAMAHVVPRTSAEIAAQRTINVDGTAAIVECARKAGVPRLVAASTVAVYGVASTEPIDEDVECSPETEYGRGKLAAEALVCAARGTSLRLALVFGPGDRGNVATLARQIRRGLSFVVGTGDNRKSVCFSEHVADRIALLIEGDHAGAAGGRFNVVDASPTQQELVSAIAAAVGGRAPRRAPIAPFLLAGRVLDAGMRLRGQTPRWQQRVAKLAESTVFDGRRLDTLLGYSPPRSLRDALGRTFASERA